MVAIVSPSWGGPSVFPRVYESGLRALEGLGLKIKEFPTARADAGFLAKNPEARADDINNAFEDEEVKAIIASIGGNDSVKILPYLKKSAIKRNPKILMGYSDTTTLLTYCNQLGLVTFHGPTVMAGFSQWDSCPPRFQKHVRDVLFNGVASYAPFDQYHEGYPDWGRKSNIGKLNRGKRATGWKCLQGEGSHRGELFGGCIDVLEFMNGTKFWPKKSYWNNKLFFLETSEEKPSPDKVKKILSDYGRQGILERVNGVLFGRARDYSSIEKSELERNILDVVNKFNQGLPVFTDLDFGHTDPQLILPLGVEAELDCKKVNLKIKKKVLI
jgi:muramoyltetrapeptide carboxypeptidase LdcA involved in peptidoglycan recycling